MSQIIFNKKLSLKYDRKMKNIEHFILFNFLGQTSNSRNLILPYKMSVFFIFTHSIKS